ncbi:MAG: hypothetical protein G01um101425_572 [Candidatus Peregrinibacteria bacterium Gr01-1014_25]|nr:MAG: hypothetical protein G01um101425_572 [Candidatus Peregrinibacteria bacterium Gr01-1014_25]
MLPEPVVQLLQEIYAEERNTEVRQKLRDNPEELLISLLTEIKQDLPNVSSMLQSTVESAAAGVIEDIKRRRAESAAKRRRKKELATK